MFFWHTKAPKDFVDCYSVALEVEFFVYLSFVKVFLLELLTGKDVVDQLFNLIISILASIFMELRKVLHHRNISSHQGALCTKSSLKLLCDCHCNAFIFQLILLGIEIKQVCSIQINFICTIIEFVI